ncbi:hypothetical protein [Nonomuraea dietziae]|uniref:Uncharacterized protein n=1 Tax=Nonomuraea dietziae TaxID=65515 RepID=A0A7W5V8A7_9ACTN|nr:hypothetical protein [Nonomuraea dietziae]MBB3732436.1 hypothetical protein [Nonomuraea dietziae]
MWNYDTNDCSDTATAGIVARRVNSYWQMSSLTWSNQPSVTLAGQIGNRGAYGIDCPEGEGEPYYTIEPMVQAPGPRTRAPERPPLIRRRDIR